MTTKNAVKKLSKWGEVKATGTGYYVHRNGWSVSFSDQWGEVICISTRRLTEDVNDHTARSYWDNLTQAIRYSFEEAAV